MAICLWGLMRALRFTVHSFHTFVLKSVVNYGHTYEIFVHTYSFQGEYGSSRNNEANVHLNFSEWKLLKPNYIFVEDQDAFDEQINYKAYQSLGDPWRNDFYSFKNHIRALNSLNHVTMAVESISKVRHFDGVIFVRPDVLFLNPLPIFLLSSSIFGKNNLFLPDFHRSCDGSEYNDRMAMGHLKAGLLYGKKLQTAYLYSQSHILHSETFTHDHIEQPWLQSALVSNGTSSVPPAKTSLKGSAEQSAHAKVVEIPFRFRRIRSNGDIHTRDHEVLTPKEQAARAKEGNYYTGHGKRTPLMLRTIYTALEYLTLGKVYIWNHDDNGNMFCSPHQKITYEDLKRFEKNVQISKHGIEAQEKTRFQTITCDQQVIDRPVVGNQSTKFIIPVNCKYSTA